MAIKIHTVKCPGCGANVSIGPGQSRVTCEYCSTQILVSEEKEGDRTAGRVSPSARSVGEQLRQTALDNLGNPDLMRQLNDQVQTLRDNVTQTMKTPLIMAWLGGSVFLILLSVVLLLIGGDAEDTGILMCMLAIMLTAGGAMFIFKVLPEKEEQRRKLRNGGIRFPKNLEPFSEKPYVVVQSSLKAAGFRNVTCVNLHDLTLGIFQQPGKVESIQVNGQAVDAGGGIYMPDVPIVIMYHGK